MRLAHGEEHRQLQDEAPLSHPTAKASLASSEGLWVLIPAQEEAPAWLLLRALPPRGCCSCSTRRDQDVPGKELGLTLMGSRTVLGGHGTSTKDRDGAHRGLILAVGTAS